MEPTSVCPPQGSLEKQQEALIADWAAKLPEAERKIVLGLPKLSTDPNSVGMEKDVSTWDEASEEADYAGMIDKEHEILMEEFHLAEGQAVSVLHWAKEREREATIKVKARVLGAILGRFLDSRKQKDIPVMLWALAFQSGLAKQMTSQNPHEKSLELGVTRALMSYWQKTFEDDLNLHDLTYAKKPEAREKYRKARLAYVQKQRGVA